jgi:hypothetical protein
MHLGKRNTGRRPGGVLRLTAISPVSPSKHSENYQNDHSGAWHPVKETQKKKAPFRQSNFNEGIDNRYDFNRIDICLLRI